MKSFIRTTLLAAAGLVVVSLPASALSSTAAGDTPVLNSATTQPIQMAARNENPGGAGYRNENPGGPGFKKKAKKKKKVH